MTIHFSPGGLGGGNAPFWAAVRWGLFERYGVEVVPTPVKGGMAAIARALSRGDLQIATVAATSLIDACLGGAELVAIMGLMNKLGFQIMSQPEIRAPADLRGRRLATSRGGTDAVIWRWFLPQQGLVPGKDAALVEVSDNEVQMDMLRRREIDAMTLSPAGSTYLKLEGFHELVDFSQQDVDFQLGTVVTTRAFLASHRDEVLAYLRGHVAALRRYKRQPEAGMQVLRGYTGVGHPEVLRVTYDTFSRRFLDWPYPSVKGFETVLGTLAELDPRARGHSPEAFIEPGPLRQLQDAAFEDELA